MAVICLSVMQIGPHTTSSLQLECLVNLSGRNTGLTDYRNYFRVCEMFSFHSATNGARIVDCILAEFLKLCIHVKTSLAVLYCARVYTWPRVTDCIVRCCNLLSLF